MTTHISWDTLNDYVDDRLPPREREEVRVHLDACAECRRTADRLREVLAEAKHSAPSLEPPESAWQKIRAEIDLRKVVPLQAAERPARRIPWARMAAVVAIAVLSSLITALVMKAKKPSQVATSHTDSVQTGVGVVPVSAVEIENRYAPTVRTLTDALEASRAKLAPETVQAVEQSLRTIDAAIAEARDALNRDPASAQLRGMLTRGYEQKIDLLRRASERAKST